ncbi:MAG: type IV pilin protein [Fidelibacterota bacterium]
MRLNKIRAKYLSSQGGFTLTELLVVLVIIGLLVLLAVPKFTSVVGKTKKTEAKLMLNQVHVLEESYRDEHDRYSQDLEEIGFEQEKLTTEGGKARYKIEIVEADDTSFVATAIAVVDIDRDGVMDKWQIDHQKELKNLK